MCCGGCGGCGVCNDCTGNILYISEKIVSFCALTSVVICIMLTLAITMGVGIGTGYNYCFVDLKVHQKSSGSAPNVIRSGIDGGMSDQSSGADLSLRRTPIKTVLDSIPHTSPSSVESYTLAIQLHANIDFPALIAKLRVRNKNATLELIT